MGRPDHPRACGANEAGWTVHPIEGGSSPRMRGKRRRGASGGEHDRIIPAHAGQTTVTLRVIMRPPDHPRACGANSGLNTSSTVITGSSPRMRGKRFGCSCLTVWRRIIPAHAGQTKIVLLNFINRADHPRACGANAHKGIKLTGGNGSSPRMRGKRGHCTCRARGRRIIPAHAGQTIRPSTAA